MATKIFTLAQVAEHNTVEDLYFVIHGKVYDVTKFAADHPGGEEVGSLANHRLLNSFTDHRRIIDSKTERTNEKANDRSWLNSPVRTHQSRSKKSAIRPTLVNSSKISTLAISTQLPPSR